MEYISKVWLDKAHDYLLGKEQGAGEQRATPEMGFGWLNYVNYVRYWLDGDNIFNMDDHALLKVATICNLGVKGWRMVLRHNRHETPIVFATALIASLRKKFQDECRRQNHREIEEAVLRKLVLEHLSAHDGVI